MKEFVSELSATTFVALFIILGSAVISYFFGWEIRDVIIGWLVLLQGKHAYQGAKEKQDSNAFFASLVDRYKQKETKP